MLNFDLLDVGSVNPSEQDDLIIGGVDQDGLNKFSRFDIAEIVLYDQALSDARVYQLEGYLAHKWGLNKQLPLAHAYYDTIPQFENRPEILLPNPFYLSFGKDQNISIPTNRSFSEIEALGLPPGLQINTDTGILSGTPSTRGNFSVTLLATNQSGTFSQDHEFIVTDYSTWPYELELNITGYSGVEPINNFPVYLELNESIEGFDYQQFSSLNGDDLIFLNSTGSTELPMKW